MDDKNIFMTESKSVKAKLKPNLVDIDSNDFEESNHSFKYSSGSLNNSKVEYHKKLLSCLQEERKKISTIDTIFKPQCNKKTASIKAEIPKNVKSNYSNNLDISISKTNYRTMCEDSNIMKDCFLSSNKCNDRSFVSLSRQSLNESLPDCGLTSTASRISNNLLKRNISNSIYNNETTKSQSTKPYVAITNRRYRIVTKKDKFSSYLNRVESSDGNIFSIGSTSNKKSNRNNNSQVPLMLNLRTPTASSSESGKRLDFSKIFQPTIFGVDQNQSPNVTIGNGLLESNWKCSNCDLNNADNFNFCPNCSQPNPKLNKPSSLTTTNVPENFRGKFNFSDNADDWMCSRCSTRNDSGRPTCVFCFQNKSSLKIDFSQRRRRFCESEEKDEDVTEVKRRRKLADDEPVRKIEQSDEAQSCESTKDKETLPEALVQTSIMVTKNSYQKWTCSGCWVENMSDLEKCPCCMTKNSSSPLSNTVKKQEQEKNKKTNNSTESSAKNWTCPDCWVDNAADAKTCVCCFHVHSKSIDNSADEKTKSVEEVSKNQLSNPIKFGSSSCSPFSFNSPSLSTKNLPKFQFGSNHQADVTVDITTEKKEVAKFRNNSDETLEKWNCPTCLVENSFTSDRCLCCQERNPSDKKVSSSQIFYGSNNITLTPSIFPSKAETGDNKSSLFQFGSISNTSTVVMTKKSDDEIRKLCKDDVEKAVKWNCPTCLVENSPSAENCVCCQERNPSHKKTSSNSTVFGSSNTSFTSSFPPRSDIGGNKPNLFQFGSTSNTSNFAMTTKSNEATKQKENDYVEKAVKWNCPTCLVENSPSTERCVCCQEQNPTGKKNLSNPIVFGSNSSQFSLNSSLSYKNEKNGKESSSIQFESFNTETKSIKEGKETNWNCPTCLVDNSVSVERCVCCQEKNPSWKSSASESQFPVNSASGFLFKSMTTKEESQSSQASVVKFQFGSTSDSQRVSSIAKIPFRFGSDLNGQNDSDVSDKNDTSLLFGQKIPNFSSGPQNRNEEMKKNDVSENVSKIDKNSDCNKFSFSKPESLAFSIGVEVPVDLVFQFSCPLKL